MAKFHGIVGYVLTKETSPGVYTDDVTERACVGDILRNTQQWEKSEKVNDNLTINNQFSIVADEFTYQNLPAIRYLEYMGTKWRVSSATIQRPRLILTVGGVYNG